jgi:ABC-2 type transport system permease protein
VHVASFDPAATLAELLTEGHQPRRVDIHRPGLDDLYRSLDHDTAQAVTGMLVIFSLLALSIVGTSVLTEVGEAAPVLAMLPAQQAVVLGFGIVVLRLRVADIGLLAVVSAAPSCRWPAMPGWARHLAPVSAYWAMSALRGAVAGGSAQVVRAVLVLLAIAAVAALLAGWRITRGWGRSACSDSRTSDAAGRDDRPIDHPP